MTFFVIYRLPLLPLLTAYRLAMQTTRERAFSSIIS